MRRVIDLDVGETVAVELANGGTVEVRLLELAETVDEVRGAIIAARARVRVGGEEAWLTSGNYHLPTTVGAAQVDCPVTKAYYRNSGADAWGLEKAARLRLWPAGSPWVEPGTFTYPARQRWFATSTQMANEVCFVDVEAHPRRERVYYHNSLDIGGAEGLTEVVAAADGVVLVKGLEVHASAAEYGARARYDQVAVLDARGWLHQYVHLKEIAPNVELGGRVTQGDPVGLLGKEGDSGGWAHLHYGISARQPSGQWSTEEGYAYLWEAYRRAHHPAVLAVARPHLLLAPGETAHLDGSRSWSAEGAPAVCRWRFGDGSTAEGATVARVYPRPGIYSEVLEVQDGQGHVDYDIATVQVYDAARGRMPAGVHAAFWPSLGLRPGQEITFLARVFNDDNGEVSLDFGDGMPVVTVRANPVKPDGQNALVADGYAVTAHRYAKPGSYLVAAEHVEATGATAVARLHVMIGDSAGEE
jgi:murein DD-endopeptidase MepM/ murein hydrolase activator NlpD